MLVVFAAVSAVIAIGLVSLTTRVADAEVERARVPAVARSASFLPALTRALASLARKVVSLTRTVEFGLPALARAVISVSRRVFDLEGAMPGLTRRVLELSTQSAWMYDRLVRIFTGLSDLQNLVGDHSHFLNKIKDTVNAAILQLRRLECTVGFLKRRMEEAFRSLAQLVKAVAELTKRMDALEQQQGESSRARRRNARKRNKGSAAAAAAANDTDNIAEDPTDEPGSPTRKHS